MTVAFRPAAAGDRAFVVDAWLSSYRTAHAAGLIAMSDWFGVMGRQVDRILDRPTTTTIVAYDPDETPGLTDLRGFISADISPGPPLVFYCFVKEASRRAGLARRLFRAAGIDPERPFLYACKTAIVAELARDRKLPAARFDPLAARYDSKTPRKGTEHDNRYPQVEIRRPRR